MKLFIDTNVYLGFYSSRKGTGEILEKLCKLIDQGKITVLLPTQVEREFHRNLSIVGKEFLKGLDVFQGALNAFHIPAILGDWDDAKKFEDAKTQVKEFCKEIKKEYKSKISTKTGVVSSKIDEIFKKAQKISISEDMIKSAQKRRFLGDPPGKSDDMGKDAVIWESLLAFTASEDLHFVAYDSDWQDAIEEKEFNKFLDAEWKSKTGKKIHFFGILGEAINDITNRQTVSRDAIKNEKEYKIFADAWSDYYQMNTAQLISAASNPFINYDSQFKSLSDVFGGLYRNPYADFLIQSKVTDIEKISRDGSN